MSASTYIQVLRKRGIHMGSCHYSSVCKGHAADRREVVRRSHGVSASGLMGVIRWGAEAHVCSGWLTRYGPQG